MTARTRHDRLRSSATPRCDLGVTSPPTPPPRRCSPRSPCRQTPMTARRPGRYPVIFIDIADASRAALSSTFNGVRLRAWLRGSIRGAGVHLARKTACAPCRRLPARTHTPTRRESRTSRPPTAPLAGHCRQRRRTSSFGRFGRRNRPPSSSSSPAKLRAGRCPAAACCSPDDRPPYRQHHAAKRNADPSISARHPHPGRDYPGRHRSGRPPGQPHLRDLTGLPPSADPGRITRCVLLDDSTRARGEADRRRRGRILDITPGVPHVIQAFRRRLDEVDSAPQPGRPVHPGQHRSDAAA